MGLSAVHSPAAMAITSRGLSPRKSALSLTLRFEPQSSMVRTTRARAAWCFRTAPSGGCIPGPMSCGAMTARQQRWSVSRPTSPKPVSVRQHCDSLPRPACPCSGRLTRGKRCSRSPIWLFPRSLTGARSKRPPTRTAASRTSRSRTSIPTRSDGHGSSRTATRLTPTLRREPRKSFAAGGRSSTRRLTLSSCEPERSTKRTSRSFRPCR